MAALLRDGRIGTARSRSLDGQQLSAAMFGPDVVTPPLLWTVIHTCEDMTAAGLLTRTTVAHDGVLPEVFTWWPDTEEARKAQRAIVSNADTATRQLRHWRRPWERRLPEDTTPPPLHVRDMPGGVSRLTALMPTPSCPRDTRLYAATAGARDTVLPGTSTCAVDLPNA